MSPPRKKVQAFSLLQMIVVVVLTAVLLSLLLPVLGRARERAAASRCVANLRQFGMALTLFIAETGAYPPYKEWWPQDDGPSKGGKIWRTVLEPYLPVSPEVDTCPSAEVRFIQGSNSHYNSKSFANYGWNAGASGTPHVRISAVPEPGKVFILGDANASRQLYQIAPSLGSWLIQGHRDTETDFGAPSRKNTFAFRHGGRANLLFLDGHVESRLPGEIPFFRPRTPGGRIFWDDL